MKTLLSTIVLGLLITAGANATLLPPGAAAAPSLLSPPLSNGTLLATVTSNFTGTAATCGTKTNPSRPCYTGTLISQVYQDPITHFLDFYYQVLNTSSTATKQNALDRLTLADFTGYNTSVFYRLDHFGGFSTPTATHIVSGKNFQPLPVTADRMDDGSGIGFDFTVFGTTQTNKIYPGNNSAVMLVRTNATQFISGTASVIDTAVVTVSDLAPAPAPEIASLMLFGTVLAVVAAFFRRKHEGTENN